MKKIFSKILGTLLLFLIILMAIGEGHLVFAAKFSLGDAVEVCNTGGLGLRIRDAPAGNIIGKKYDGDRGVIVGGPEAAALDGIVYTWWKIRWDATTEGWSAEGYPGGVDYLVKVTMVGEPTVTESLVIYPVKSEYYIGETISASFTITNRANVPFVFDVLTVGGRDPDDQVVDFTFRTGIFLNPGESYTYTGTLTLPAKTGKYHFFCAYRRLDGTWNPAIPTEGGATNTLDIYVYPPPTPSRTLTVYSSPSGVTFTVDGVSHATPWSATYSQGASVSLVMPPTHSIGEEIYYWNKWSDGVTSRSRTIAVDTDIILTAYYIGPYYQLTVTSSPITGIPFTINGISKTTSYTDWLPQGSYTVEMPATYSGYTWSHWLEDSDTNRMKTFTLSSTKKLTAIYATPAPSMSITFEEGDHIKIIIKEGWRIRETPEIRDDNIIKVLPAGSTGLIIAHPDNGKYADGFYWWRTKFEVGSETYEGWCAENGLMKYKLTHRNQEVLDTKEKRINAIREAIEDFRLKGGFGLRGKMITCDQNFFNIFPPELILAIIAQETGGVNYDNTAKGDGVMQVTTASGYHRGKENCDEMIYVNTVEGIRENIKDGLMLLYELYTLFSNGDQIGAVWRYNGGLHPYWTYGGFRIYYNKDNKLVLKEGIAEGTYSFRRSSFYDPPPKDLEGKDYKHYAEVMAQGDKDYLRKIASHLKENGRVETDFGEVYVNSDLAKRLEIAQAGVDNVMNVNKLDEPIKCRDIPNLNPFMGGDANEWLPGDYIVPTKIRLTQVTLHSPVELRVYDSQGRVTGLVNGELREEIPNSIYNKENETLTILFSYDTYRYEVVCKEEGIYELMIVFIAEEKAVIFNATRIPASINGAHQYTIDWLACSHGEEGVNVLVDADGDGLVERVFSSDSELANEEFVEKTSPEYPTYALTINATEGGTTYPSPGIYACSANSTVYVTAIPETTYKLDFWELDGINVGSANPYAAFMNENHTIKAVFSYAPPLLKISGTIRDKLGNPIPNVQIVAQDALTEVDVASTTSNETGKYAMLVPLGTYNLIVTPPPESVFAPTTISNIEVTKDTVIDIVLVPAETVTLSGQVVDRDGNPWPNVYISVYSAAVSQSAYTNESGQFSLNVPPDYYDLELGYWNWMPGGYERFDFYKRLNITKDTFVTFTLENRYLSGIVLDPSGNSVANVSIYANGWTSFNDLYGWFETWTTTDNNGNFKLKVFTSPSISLKATPPPEIIYGPVNVIINVTEDSSFTVTLAQTVAFSGLIVDRDGNPVPNVYVSVYSAAISKSNYTDEYGRFIMHVPPDYYDLELGYWNWMPGGYERFDFYKRLNITKDTFVTFTLENRYLSGIVLDPSGNSVANVSIYANGWTSFNDLYGWFETWTMTDIEGKFNVTVFASPSVSLKATPPPENPYGPISTTINVTEDIRVTITLAQTVTFSGQVLDRDGKPIPNVYISLYSAAISKSAYTNDQGLFSLNVPPDYYDLELGYWNWMPGGYERFDFYKRLNITKDTFLIFTLQNRYLTGKVDVEGKPVANVSIYVNGWASFDDFYGSFETWTITDSAGRFNVTVFTCPSVTIKAIPPPESIYAPTTLTNIDVTDDKMVLIALFYKAGVLPTPNFTWSPETPEAGQSVTFDASSSMAGSGIIIRHKWSFGDGTYAIGKIVTHTFSNPGVYTVTLNVTNSKGLWSVIQKQIEVVELPGPKAPIANFTYTPANPIIGEEVTFDASASYDPDGEIVSYTWDFGDGSISEGKIAIHSYDKEGNYKVTLTVIDNDGKSSITSQTVTVVKPLDVPVETSGLVIKAMSPVDLIVIDPDYLVICKEYSEIPSAVYMEIDLNGDGSLDDYIFIPEPKTGQYIITVVPEPGADPTATYTIAVATRDATILLAENVPISNIPPEPYIINPTKFETPPTTILTIGTPKHIGPSNNLYVSSETLFTLEAQDNPGGSGVNTTLYRISNDTYITEWQTYIKPFKLAGLVDGIYTIEYKSIDNAGNVELSNTVTVILDSTPPETAITVGEPKYVSDKIYVAPETPFRLDASDGEGSGVFSTSYRIYSSIYDSGWLSYTEQFNLTGLADGAYTIEYYSVDNVGNVEEAKSIQVTLRSKIHANIDICPDTLNLKSRGKWVTAYIELPEGYNVSDINIASITLNGTIPVDLTAPCEIGDYDNDGIPDLMVKFNRTAVSELILSEGVKCGNVTLTVSGKLNDGTEFEGSDVIRVSARAGDINMDGVVDMRDIAIVAKAFGTFPGRARWNPMADENEDGVIDVFDIALVAKNFGKTYT